jgi:hypothetical protein
MAVLAKTSSNLTHRPKRTTLETASRSSGERLAGGPGAWLGGQRQSGTAFRRRLANAVLEP